MITIAYYKTDVIKAGDTLQSIMFRNFGTVEGWHDSLADLNDLEYPYIVDTDEARLKNPAHLLSVGDVIRLPIENTTDELTVDSLSNYTMDSVYDTTMGSDLRVEINQGQLFDENTAELVPDKKREDLDTLAGVKNLRQSLFLRIMTRRGTLLMHPNYGSYIPDYIGKPIDKSTLEDIKVELQRTVTTDTRVSNVEIIGANLDHQEVFVAMKVTPISAEEAFNLFLYRAENGEFLLN